MRRSLPTAAVAVLAIAALVACGSDDGGESDRDAALTTSTTSSDTVKPKPFRNPAGKSGKGGPLVPVGAATAGTASTSTARTVRFQTTYRYGTSLYLLPYTNVFVYRGTSTSGTPIRRTSNASGIASFSLTRGTRYTITARKVQGSCTSAKYIYYEPSPWALTVPATPPSFYRLTLSWRRVC